MFYLAQKYHLNPTLLVDAFITAWKNDTSSIASLEIMCRQADHDLAIFLVTHRGKVVSQFPIEVRILNNPAAIGQDFSVIPEVHDEKTELKFTKIDELRLNMRRVNVRAEVIDIPQKMLVTTRWGSQAYISNACIADDSGSIKLCLWNDQISHVQAGDVIQVENGYIHTFAGELQLRLRRKSTLSIISRNN